MEFNIFWLAMLCGMPSAYRGALLFAPTLQSYPVLYGAHSTSILTPTHQQYHTQDDLGQYAYGYSDHLSTKQEVRRLDGLTEGSYSYVDPDGLLQTVDYRADKNGFRVAATNLPQPTSQTISLPAVAPVAPVASVASVASIADSANSISGSIQSVGKSSDTVRTTGWLHLAGHTTADGKPVADTANVRTVELSHTLADTSKIAPASYYLKHQPLVLASRAGIAPYGKFSTPLIHKTYGLPYSSNQNILYNGGLYY